MKCSTPDCESKATLAVIAFGERAWRGIHCDKHAGRLIKLRGKFIRKYKQNVTVRPITKLDKRKHK